MKKKMNRALSFFLTIVMLVSTMSVGFFGITAIAANVNVTNDHNAIIVVPETVYMTPSTGASTSGQYYVNNTLSADGKTVSTDAVANSVSANIFFYIPGAKDFTMEVSAVESGYGDIQLSYSSLYGGYNKDLIFDQKQPIGASYGAEYGPNSSGYMKIVDVLGLYIVNGNGVTAGNSITAEWKFTVTMNDGTTRVYYAYSTLYAPWYQPVGAAAKAKGAWHNTFASSILWVSGVHGYSDGDSNNRKYVQTANFLPMINAIKAPDNNNPDTHWIQSDSNGLSPTINYQDTEAGGTKYHARANSISPTANLTVDTSRYNNFNQIPNFKVGFMVTDRDGTNDSGSNQWYVSDFTGQTSSYYNGTASGGSQYTGDWDSAGTKFSEGSDRNTGVKYNGAWNKAISGTANFRIKSAVKSTYKATITSTGWNNNFVNISVTGTNKDALRQEVLKGSTLNANNYTTATWNAYLTELRAAAQRLGNPTATDVSTSNLTKQRDALQTTVTLNANGGSIATTSFNATVGAAATPSYNVASYTPTRTGYDFVGWATSSTATSGSKTTVTAGLMPTLYAVWTLAKYNVVFDNMLDYTKFTINTGALTIDERTDTGFTVISKEATDGNTGFSYAIPVTPGKTYVFSADVAIEMVAGDTRGYDMYIHTLDANQAGETSATPDTSNGAHREGDVYISLTGQKQNNNNAYIRFTAGATTAYIKVRFDANTEGNKLTVNNIRVYEEGTVADGVSYVPPESVTYTGTYGELPTPTRPGYDFAGWFVGDKQINSTDKVDITDTLYVTSKWTPKKYTVTWKNGDTVLETDYNVIAGTIPTYNGPDPTAPQATAQFTYTWDRNDGWDKTVSAVTGDITYTAKFKETLRTYTVTWKDGDGKTIKTESLEYGATPSYTGAAPTKTATAQYTYTWNNTWSPAISKVTGDATYTAQFTGTLNKYTVTWENYDGTVLGTETYDYNAMPSFSGTPAKPEDNQYSYTFSGWADEDGVVGLRKVTGNVTYTAQFTGTLKTYTVTWKDGNGNVIETDTSVSFGTVPTYDSPVAPTKTSTAQYSYTWTGAWDAEVVAVTGNVTYTATFTETLRTYTVTWKDGNGDVIETDNDVPYGTMPSYDGADPVKAGNAQYSYTWTGEWDAELVAVAGNVTYTATFTQTVNEYTITFVNEDNTVLQSGKVKFGETPEYKGEKPTKAATVQYSYEFKDWTPAIKAVDGDATYTATFTETVNEYTITFVNEDGTELQSGKVPYGDTPVYTGETPEKAEDVQFTYEWNGWDPAVVAVTGDATYTATFEGKTKSYTVTWLSNNVAIKTDIVPYGTMPEYKGETPVKAEDAQYSYTFKGWSPALTEVKGNQSYDAVFEPVLRSYTITFVNEDGTELWSDEFAYGTEPVYGGEEPSKQGNAQYSYTFLGWDPEIKTVTGEATYTATFTESTNAYTVTWKNYDGSVLATDTVEYGTTPEYKGETPVKTDSTGKYTYTFAGWEPEVDEVTGDAVYTAKFTETINKYTIKFVNEDGTELQSEELEYDTMPVYKGETPTKATTAQYTFTWTGWTPEIALVTGDATYKATYSETVNKYTVTWKNEDGTTLETDQNVEFGKTPSYDGEKPTKASTAQYSYEFKGWTPAVEAVSGDTVYTAEFEAVTRSYTIKFVDEDNKVLYSTEVEYGETPVYNGETPVKAATVQYSYEFDGWTPAIAEVTGEATYKVVFKETVNKYTIKFVNEDGTVLQSTDVAYGETPAYTGATPEKAADKQFTYTWTGAWDKEVVAVTGEATYKATYSTTINTYTVTWLNANGYELETDENVPYGATPEFNGDTPEKAADAKFTYAFAGWTPAISTVEGNVSYTATFTETLRKYTVTWKNGENVLETDTGVEYGTEPSYDGAQPTKASTAQYSFTFEGWDPVVSTVTGDVTYTAKFTENLRSYTVTWKNYDGEVLATDTVAYGTTPVYAGETPVKASTPEYTYAWTNAWDKEVVAVTGDAEYTATFTETLRSYKVTWIVDGKEWATEDVLVGYAIPEKTVPAKEGLKGAWDYVPTTMPTNDVVIKAVYINNGITVTWIIDENTTKTTVVEENETIVADEAWKIKESTVDTVYTFVNWYEDAEFTKVAVFPEVKAGDNDLTYYAKFDTSVREYTIKFVDENGTELQSGNVAYGKTPEYKGEKPTKAATDQYTYEFSGWTPAVTAVSGDAVYTATYKATVNEYTVTFVNEDGTELQSGKVAYGETPAYTGATPTKAATAQYTYTFSGWTPTIEEVTGEATYTATYSSTVNEYTITFVNEGGAVLQSGKVAYGETPAYTGATPTKAATAEFTFTWTGWTPAIAEVTGDATYTATYDSTVNEYTVIWTDEDGTVLETDENVAYGATPTFDGTEPSKAPTAQYTYTFAGWDPAVENDTIVTGNVTYKAIYTSTVNTYTVVWKNEDGTVLETDENVAYGTTPTYDGETPVKAATDEFTYTFANSWTPAVKAVEGDAEYTAVFNATKNSYTVKFVKADGEEISYTLEYGESFTTPANSTKDADATYHYTYAWTPAVNTTVTGNATYTEVLTSTEHTWSDWTTILAPTCTATGIQQRECACHYVETETLSMVPHTEDEAVIENNVAPTCTNEGSYDTVVYCTVCKGELSRVETIVDVVPHTEGEAVIENNVDPDCVNEGSYETVVYCTVCKGELSRVKTTVDALGHTEGEEVIENNVKPDCVNEGSYETVVYCTVCDEELSRDTTTVDALGHTEGEAVIENNVDPDCVNEGSYETVVYCTVCDEELSRDTTTVDALGHTEGEAVIENNVDPDCENEGSYETVVYCTVCDEELSRDTTTVDALGHTEGEAVIENNVDPDCDSEGSYETVVYCTVCDEELSRVKTTVDALGHTKGEAVKENEHIESCLEGGSYEEVFYCTVCDAEISRETIKVSGKHTPDVPVIENEVKASCMVPSSYDEVVYCKVCGDEVSRNTVIGSTIDHKPAKAVKENIREATCNISGSYDNVVRCSVCYAELSRTTVNTGAKGHTIVVDKAVESTCTQTGKTVGSHCSVCNVVIVAQTTVPAKGHTIVYDRGYDPTCTRTGLTEGSHCMVCDIVVEEQEVIPALGHLDENGDGICDIDGRDVTDMDPDYGIEVGPDGDGGNHNEHICNICGREHINFFSEIICLIYKILRIFGYKVK